MRLKFQLRIMLLAISRERSRMALAVSAVALGLMAVTIQTSLQRGASRELREVMSQIAINVITLSPAKIQAIANRGGGWYTSEKLKHEDIDSVIGNVPQLRAVVPEVEESLPLRYRGAELTTSVKGVGLDFPAVRGYEIASGRFFSAADDAGNERVAILGESVIEKLNDGFSMLDETVWIRGIGFKVIGQFKAKGLSEAGTNLDDLVVIPYGTARTRVYSRDNLDRILVQTASDADVAVVLANINDILRDNHRISADEKADFEVLRPFTSDLAKQTTSELLRGVAFFFTAITLLIGGIGILMVAHLNVMDRRAEIGLRMALGATRLSIVVLFVLEAVLLSVIGCIIGCTLGAVATYLLRLYTQWQVALDAAVIIVPVLTAVMLGLVFGAFPAYQASRVLPAQALRSE